jgi:ureidoglycolate lyase
METPEEAFVFTSENFQAPNLEKGLKVIDVPVVEATTQSLSGYGHLVRSPDDFTTATKTFEIVRWPTSGWRKLDPDTGDEAGTTEGNFSVRWEGDYYYAENFAVATTNNKYLDGLAVPPEHASRDASRCAGDGNTIHLWMSDYHPGRYYLTMVQFVYRYNKVNLQPPRLCA